LDVVHHVEWHPPLGHPRRRALVLHDARRARPPRHAILHVHLKAFLADLRLTQLGFEGRFDLGIAELTCTVRLSQGSRGNSTLAENRKRITMNFLMPE
jgi:hypothetical protein